MNEPIEENDNAPIIQPQTQQGKIAALIISPDGQPVYQAKFWLVDSQGQLVEKSTGGIAYDAIRHTTQTGNLETLTVSNGQYTLNIDCAAHCMFGEEVATNVASDIYARWSQTVKVEINQLRVDLGTITLKKWTEVTFFVTNGHPFLKIEIVDGKGHAVRTEQHYMHFDDGEAKYSLWLPDGTYTLRVGDNSGVAEKMFSTKGGSLDLGALVIEER